MTSAPQIHYGRLWADSSMEIVNPLYHEFCSEALNTHIKKKFIETLFITYFSTTMFKENRSNKTL